MFLSFKYVVFYFLGDFVRKDESLSTDCKSKLDEAGDEFLQAYIIKKIQLKARQKQSNINYFRAEISTLLLNYPSKIENQEAPIRYANVLGLGRAITKTNLIKFIP